MNKRDDASLNIFDLIDQICAGFRQSWKSGSRPDIEEWLLKVPESARPQLFRNLLPIDTRYRERGGESPSSDDYVRRFPQFKHVIGDAFNFSTSVSNEGLHGTSVEKGIAHTVSLIEPAAKCIGDYELIRQIGRGGFGIVYEAEHIKSGNRVALKTLPTGVSGQEETAERLHRFRNEFRSLAELNHPNLVGMQTLEVEGGQWFLTMELIHGTDFLSYVRTNETFDEGRLRQALNQLIAGVFALHARRIIHRDLKPNNVLVDEDGRVVILDFGLVAQLERAGHEAASLLTQHFAGTPRYAAPEQLFGERSQATDWYAVGVMLYESLIGEAPFSGKPQEILAKKREEDAPALSGRSNIPSDLATLVDQLLDRDPKSRPDGREIAERLNLDTDRSDRDSRTSHGGDSQWSFGTTQESVLIGRENQLQLLDSLRQTVLEQDRPAVAWVRGLSGEGKSHLVEKFLHSFRTTNDYYVLSGRCYDRESVPFKVIDCWIDSLVSLLRQMPEDQLKAILPNDIVALAEIFPVLARIPAISSLPPLNSQFTSEQLRFCAFASLRELFVQLSKDRPIILFVDDLQWGDADSVAGMQTLLKGPNAPRLMFIGSYRADEQSGSPILKGMGQRNLDIEQLNIELGPLSERQSLELFAHFYPDALPKYENEVLLAHRKSGGNPYLFQSLIDRFDSSKEWLADQSLESSVRERLSRLPEEATKLLELIAVFGQAITISDLHALSGLTTSPFATITRMRNEKLIRLIGDEQHRLVDTLHDKIRETIIDGLSGERQIEWHQEIAENLEKLSNNENFSVHDMASDQFVNELGQSFGIERLYELANHFFEANSPRALDYLILAGEESLRIFSNDEAQSHFNRARMRLQEATEPELRFRVLSGMGTALIRAGEAEEAVDLLNQSVEIAESPRQRLLVFTLLGMAHRDLGQTNLAIEKWDRALNACGHQRPTSAFSLITRLAYWIPTTLAGPNFVWGARTEERAKREAAATRLYALLAPEVVEKKILLSVACCYGSAVSAIRSKSTNVMPVGLATGRLAFEFSALSKLANFQKRRLEKWMSRSPVESDGNMLEFYDGFSDYLRGRLALAEASATNGIRVSESRGDFQSSLFCQHLLRHVLTYSGSATREVEVATREYETAITIGDNKGVLWGAYAIADGAARQGNLTLAFERFQNACSKFGDERWLGAETACGSSLGFVLLQASEYKRATQLLSFNFSIIKNDLAILEFGIRSLPYLIESILGPRWTEFNPSNEQTRLRRISRWIKLLFNTFPTLQPSIHRALGRLAIARKKQRKGIRHFEKARKLAIRYEMPYFEAKSLLDLAAVKDENRRENRSKAIERLKQMESVIPRAESWLLGDQFCEEVVAPYFDLAAWEKEHGAIPLIHGNESVSKQFLKNESNVD